MIYRNVMRMRGSFYFQALFMCLAVCLLSYNAYAQCTSPAGVSGEIEYDTGSNNYEFCNGSNWVPFISEAGAACTNTAELQWSASDNTYIFCDGTTQRIICEPCSYTGCGPSPSFSEEDSLALTNLGRDDNIFGIWSDGTYLYAAEQEDGFAVYEFDGTSLSELEHDFKPSSTLRSLDIKSDGTYIYGTTVFNPRLCAMDFDGTSLSVVGTCATMTDYPWHVDFDDNYIYVADSDDGLKAYTFNGTTFTLRGTWDSVASGNDAAGEIATDGTYIYVGSGASAPGVGNRGGDIYALSFNGTTFTLLDTETIHAGTDGVPLVAAGGYIYALDRNSNNDELIAFSFNGTTFTELDRIDIDLYTGGRVISLWAEPNGTYVYVGDADGGNFSDGWAISAFNFDGSSFTHEDSFTGGVSP